MKHLILLFIAVISLLSCDDSNGGRRFTDETQPDDSVQLRIAVMPTLDCLPVYVADACGIFDKHNLDVCLLPFNAQMDCDTAFQRGWANAMVTDLVRAQRMKEEGMDLQYITSTEASWQLLTNSTARIKNLQQLDDHMMAMTRFSATHLLSDFLTDSAQLKTERVFRIQINDVNVRLSMLQAGIMDALLLPEPQATAARNAYARLLFDSQQRDFRLGVIIMGQRAANSRHIDAFKKAYDMACDSINEQGIKYYANLIKKCCNTDKNTIDSLPQIFFNHASEPRKTDIERVEAWLNKKKTHADEQGI